MGVEADQGRRPRFEGKLWRVLAATCCSTVTAGYNERLLGPNEGSVCPIQEQRGNPGLGGCIGYVHFSGMRRLCRTAACSPILRVSGY